MCRFVLYRGPAIGVSSLVTEPSNSIIHQSFHSHEREEPLNGDGFGVAWYEPSITDRPAVFKDVSPAWNNMNLRNIAAVTRSRCVLAHVRAATLGLPVILPNCHPFAWGPFAFMHNGSVEGFVRLRRTWLAQLSDEAFGLIQGSTDSEYLFATFVDRYRERSDEPPAGEPGGAGAFRDHGAPVVTPPDRREAMLAATMATIADVEALRAKLAIEEPASLNLAVTDGYSAVVTRYISHTPERANTLYVHRGLSYECRDGTCRMLPVIDGPTTAVIIASEPLSEGPGWERVPPGHVVSIGKDLDVYVDTIASGEHARP